LTKKAGWGGGDRLLDQVDGVGQVVDAVIGLDCLDWSVVEDCRHRGMLLRVEDWSDIDGLP